MNHEIVETDVLCVGGGIAGLMAAIRAGELGANVVVAEKGNTLRSGAGATGNDHFACYIPEVHGPDIGSVIKERQRKQTGGKRLPDPELVPVWFEKSFDIVKLWDSWGIPMKYKGKYEFAGHTLPGRPFASLKYAGQGQKIVLTNEAVTRGVKIINRVMVFDLLANDGVIGAIGFHTREDKLIEFRAKSVVLATGSVSRLYPGLTPGWMFNLTHPGTLTGDGRAMGYRIGAELVNVEMPGQHVGPKYFARGGQATWVGVLRDPQGKPVGPFVTRPDRRYGDIMAEVHQGLFLGYAKSGRGPVYMDCRGISDEDYEYMMHWFEHEGYTAYTNHLKEEGIDLRENPIEFTTYVMRAGGGMIWHNAKGETSVKGLFTAGDETTTGISPAATFGWIAGDNAAKYATGVKSPNLEAARARIEARKRLHDEIRGRRVGPHWKEVNIALQQVMNDYAGSIRSETLLEAGLDHLRRLREKALATMVARNPHELVRGLEVLNLLDLGELVFITARQRQETRALHVRADYTFTNPLLDRLLVVKKSGERAVTQWR